MGICLCSESRTAEPLPPSPGDPDEILDLLHAAGSPATVAQTGGRYFGFVNGSAFPVALAARWLADVWDQNAAMYVTSPVAAHLEAVCEAWLVDLFSLPGSTTAGFVSGTSTATFCGLAAARNHLLGRMGPKRKGAVRRPPAPGHAGGTGPFHGIQGPLSFGIRPGHPGDRSLRQPGADAAGGLDPY